MRRDVICLQKDLRTLPWTKVPLCWFLEKHLDEVVVAIPKFVQQLIGDFGIYR